MPIAWSIAERMWRINTAAIALPSTNAGMTVVAIDCQKSSKGLTNPDAGSQPSVTENRKMKRMPSQKFGVDSPHSAKRFTPTSHAVSFFTADITPAGMPMRSAMRIAIVASCSVTGSFSRRARTPAA